MAAPQQKGNALFLILIAVALFAALGYAISQSGRGSGSVSKEQASMDLAQLTQVAADMSQAITRLELGHGCADSQISFESSNNSWSGKIDGSTYDYTNVGTPADGSCKLFDPNGGGLTQPPLIPASLVVDPSGVCSGCLRPQDYLVSSAVVTGVGTSASDLIMWIGRLTKQQCIAVNNSFGVTNTGGSPPVNTFNGNDGPFQGTYGTVDTVTAPELAGQYDFCFDWGGGVMGYLYVHVLLAR